MYNDPLGIRMKERYESRSQTYLPRRSYTILRLDGKAWHSFTHNCERPYDQRLMDWMDETTKFLCEEIQGAVFGYTQSDEISILLTDFSQILTEAWFDGNVQKMCSISASLATAYFNKIQTLGKLAYFDSRCFVISDPVEVRNYFIWRQMDAVRNAINMAGQSMYSHKELHGKNTDQVQEMIFQKGKNFNEYPARFKRGGCIVKAETGWKIEESPIFTQEVDYLKKIVPIHPDFEYKP